MLGTHQVGYFAVAWIVVGCLVTSEQAAAEEPPPIVIPHHQSEAPGPALSPAEAIEKMVVPDGFRVELVASEPDLMNPVAMAIDHRGRFWVTESFEYPRRSAGPGRDRIKILEDTDHDGRVDRVTVFAEGLNIPSGIALGYGGVWVANSPDLLFLQDTDGDGRADRQEVVVTGFGRADTHELPNSLTWGPDGWLYGLNGVFNPGQVTQGGRTFAFTCTMFRIHPRTREFQLFAEGTSNPWGIAFDSEGSAFISACVIDHLWHLTERGYYHRQGGPYPPHTWKLGSIVDYTHQMAAYCGLTYFDSDAYPESYREKLYMGNIHGGCINVDELHRAGATYQAQPAADFLTAHDAWFMPVVQKTGPDGCLYILDWYDRYHCYQDANRDPAGIDRGRGRLYRVRYEATPRAPAFDLEAENDEQLMERLSSPNIFFRELAQRLLAERGVPTTQAKLEQLVRRDDAPRKARLHALWALIGSGPLRPEFHASLLQHSDPTFRAWGVRAAGNQAPVPDALREVVAQLADDPAPDVRVQVAIAAPKLAGADAVEVLLEVLAHPDPDDLIPHIVWQNLLPALQRDPAPVVARLTTAERPSDGMNQMLPPLVEFLLAQPPQAPVLAQLLARVAGAGDRWPASREALQALRESCLNDPRWQGQRGRLREPLLPVLRVARSRADADEADELTMLAALLEDPESLRDVRGWITADQPPRRRRQGIEVLAATGDLRATRAAAQWLSSASADEADLLSDVVAVLGRSSDPRVATLLLECYPRTLPALRPRLIELLTQRNDWAVPLLTAIRDQQLPRESLHINQVRRLQDSNDATVRDLVGEIWGKVREGRNPEVEQSIAKVEQWLGQRPGDAVRGRAVFQKSCAQCHQIYGQGEQVGPDITANGRASFAQLLSNVFDPNLVIGPAYQARTVLTRDGRSLSGLLIEDGPQRVVLKLQGGKVESLDREEIEALIVSPLSLMPEGWEKQLAEQEVVDLLHFLTLDGPPENASSNRLPGTPPLIER